MTPDALSSDPGASSPDRSVRERRLDLIAIGLLVATVVFNPVLAIVNGHFLRLGSGPVALMQAAIVFGALAIGATSRPAPTRWFVFVWALVLGDLTIALIRGELGLKNIGDALLVPAFVCLGTRLDERLFLRAVAWLQATVVVVGMWELLDPKGFGFIFKVLDYYVATRGFNPKEFYGGGDLFVSSVRGGGRYLLAFTNWHRGSSIFLEPVSLGNWACVMTLFVAAFWDRFTWVQRALYAFSIVMVLIICDGRLALGVCLILAVWLPLSRFIPGRMSMIYLPVFIAMLAMLQGLGYLPQTGDTLSGRLRGGFDLLFDMDTPQLFGLGDMSPAAVDAGWVYLIETQSVLIALALWLAFTLSDTGERPTARMMKHGVALFVVLCMPISYAVFSVKTSALMWAVYGIFFQQVVRAQALERGANRRDIFGRRRQGTNVPA